MSNFKEENKVNQTEAEKAYIYQYNLRDNEEYKNRVNKTFTEFVDLFNQKYPKASLDIPVLRAKSFYSLEKKINKLEIERLCIKYAMKDISLEEKNELIKLMKNKADNEKYAQDIDRVMSENIKDTKLIDRMMKDKELNGYVKMALLRIARIKIYREVEDIEKKENLITYLDEKYGEKAAIITGKLKNNIMHWENVRKALNNEEERKKVNNPQEYLKVKDLRAFRFVIADVNEDIETDDVDLKNAINERKKASKKEKIKCKEKCCKALERVFCNYLATDEELLQSMNLKLVYRKQKDKQNGYCADHLKFCYIDKPEFTFEMQVRSIYVDDISRLDGPAGHKFRPDKDRDIIDTSSFEKTEEEVERKLPKYEAGIQENGRCIIKDFKPSENFAIFYQGYEETEEFKKGIEYLDEKNKNVNTK